MMFGDQINATLQILMPQTTTALLCLLIFEGDITKLNLCSKQSNSQLQFDPFLMKQDMLGPNSMQSVDLSLISHI